jgi:zinc transport system permease protein
VIDSFLFKPFLAIILISLTCSLISPLILWKKISYFGDSLSHAIIFGLLLGAIFEFSQNFSLIIFAFLFAFLTLKISQNKIFSKDSIIMILAYFSVSVAILLNDIFIKNFDFSSYIFGDILVILNEDLAFLSLVFIAVLIFIILGFKKMLKIVIDKDLARISGIKVELWDNIFLILLSVIIALGVKIVGIFLMTALLVLPAAIARIYASCAIKMLILSSVISLVLAIVSFKIALNFDLKIGATIISILSIIFFISLAIEPIFRKIKNN